MAMKLNKENHVFGGELVLEILWRMLNYILINILIIDSKLGLSICNLLEKIVTFKCRMFY